MKKKLLKLYYPEQLPFPEEACLWHKVSDRTLCGRRRVGPVLFSEYTLSAGQSRAAGKKILFLSDFHWHGTEKNHRILRAIQQIAAENTPDLLLLGGDLTGDASHIPLLCELLPELRRLAPEVIAVTGNWESGKFWLPLSFWQELYREYDIRLLLNDTCEMDAFFICGTTAFNSYDVRLAASGSSSAELYPILLSHMPDAVVALSALEGVSQYPLILCGHTHGGQWRLPFGGGPLYIPGRYGRRFDQGLFQRENSNCCMLISSGLGELSLRWRFFCPPEVVLIRFGSLSR